MAAAPTPVRMSLEEYLAFERAAIERHEYWDGKVYAMAGGTRNHDDICMNLAFAVKLRLQGKSCWAHSANMKVGIT